MSTLPAHPLVLIVAAAAATLPARTDAGDASRRRHQPTGSASIVLADVSGSMHDVAWGSRRKIDLLRDALGPLIYAGPHILIAFADRAERVQELPEPAGSTRLHLALDAARAHDPAHTLVISDGQPDDESAALTAAEHLPGTIDTLYIGPDGDRAAIDFMIRLARVGAGRAQRHDISRAGGLLGQSIRLLLTTSQSATTGASR